MRNHRNCALQAEQRAKVERWSLLEGEDLAAALQQYPAAAGACAVASLLRVTDGKPW